MRISNDSAFIGHIVAEFDTSKDGVSMPLGAICNEKGTMTLTIMSKDSVEKVHGAQIMNWFGQREAVIFRIAWRRLMALSLLMGCMLALEVNCLHFQTRRRRYGSRSGYRILT